MRFAMKRSYSNYFFVLFDGFNDGVFPGVLLLSR